jgi:hypothetical protein
MPAAGRGPGVAAKNQIRDSIKALFPDRWVGKMSLWGVTRV